MNRATFWEGGLPLRRTFDTDAEFDLAWNAPPSLRIEPGTISEIAHFVAGGLARDGFRLFANGGLPLLERRRDPLWEEIVFVPGTGNAEFAVRFHLSHAGVGRVRGSYWRPATRAPKIVAAGDIGRLETPATRTLWSAKGHTRTAEAVLRALTEHVLPWFDVFDDPAVLRSRLTNRDLPLIDLSTALELMLAEFGEREARHFLRAHLAFLARRVLAPESVGYDLQSDRVPTIAAYYRL